MQDFTLLHAKWKPSETEKERFHQQVIRWPRHTWDKWLHMYKCTYTCTSVQTHVQVYIHMYKCTYTCTSVQTHVQVYRHMYKCTDTCTSVHTHVQV